MINLSFLEGHIFINFLIDAQYGPHKTGFSIEKSSLENKILQRAGKWSKEASSPKGRRSGLAVVRFFLSNPFNLSDTGLQVVIQ